MSCAIVSLPSKERGGASLIGTWGLLYQLLYVLLSGAVSATSLFLYFRSRAKVSLIGFLSIPCFFYLVFVFITHADRVSAMRHLDARQVSSETYKGQEYRETTQVQAVAEALHQCVWYARPRQSSYLGPSHLLVIRFSDGNRWIIQIFQYPYASGTILDGDAYNPVLERVLGKL